MREDAHRHKRIQDNLATIRRLFPSELAEMVSYAVGGCVLSGKAKKAHFYIDKLLDDPDEVQPDEILEKFVLIQKLLKPMMPVGQEEKKKEDRPGVNWRLAAIREVSAAIGADRDLLLVSAGGFSEFRIANLNREGVEFDVVLVDRRDEADPPGMMNISFHVKDNDGRTIARINPYGIKKYLEHYGKARGLKRLSARIKGILWYENWEPGETVFRAITNERHR